MPEIIEQVAVVAAAVSAVAVQVAGGVAEVVAAAAMVGAEVLEVVSIGEGCILSTCG